MGREVQRNPMDQPPVQQDHLNQDRSHTNATSVGGGGVTALEIVPPQETWIGGA